LARCCIKGRTLERQNGACAGIDVKAGKGAAQVCDLAVVELYGCVQTVGLPRDHRPSATECGEVTGNEQGPDVLGMEVSSRQTTSECPSST